MDEEHGPHVDGDDEHDDQVRNALLKGLAAVVIIGLVIAIGTVLVVRALGLDDDSAAGPVGSGSSGPVEPLPTTALPVPGEESASASDDPTDKPTKRPKGALQLQVSPIQASAMERINLTGTYRGNDNVPLEVQRYEDGTWSNFGVQATVRVGTYATYIMTGRAGENRFRMFDPTTKRGSNVVLVTIG